MSAELSTEMPIENTVVSTETAGKKTRVKKPVLAVKLLKYLDFGFQVVQNLHSAGLLDDEGLDLAFAQIKLLSSVEDQTAFYSNFLDQSNDTAKILRKFIVAKLKPVPLKKSRAKSNAKTNTDTTDPVDPVANKPVKATRVAKPKKTTRTVADADDDIIGALAQAALSREPQVPLRSLPSDDTTEPLADAKTKKPRKKPEPKAKVDAEPEVISELAPAITAEPEVIAQVAAEPVVDTKTKKPRKKPEPSREPTVPLRPLPSDDTTDNTTEPVLDTKTKKPRKKPEPSREPTDCIVQHADLRPLPSDDTTDNTTEPVVDTKTKKPRKKPEPKAKISTQAPPTITPDPSTPHDDIHANEIIIDQRLFLIDQHNQLYDPHSFNLIAIFDPILKSISSI